MVNGVRCEMEPHVGPMHALAYQVKCEMEPPLKKGLAPFYLGAIGEY